VSHIKKLIPTSIRETLFVFLTFCNAGVTAFFAATGFYNEAIFSSITSLLCFGVWVSEIRKK
jgi:hypothetical protein